MINQSENNKRAKVFVAMSGGVDSSVVAGIVLAFLLVVVSGTYAQEVKFSQEWSDCQKNQDCVVVSGLCDWECINASSVEEAEQKFYSKIKPVIECAPGGYKEPRPDPVCIQNKCSCEFQGKKKNDSTK